MMPTTRIGSSPEYMVLPRPFWPGQSRSDMARVMMTDETLTWFSARVDSSQPTYSSGVKSRPAISVTPSVSSRSSLPR
jgi:hypothetical protein